MVAWEKDKERYVSGLSRVLSWVTVQHAYLRSTAVSECKLPIATSLYPLPSMSIPPARLKPNPRAPGMYSEAAITCAYIEEGRRGLVIWTKVLIIVSNGCKRDKIGNVRGETGSVRLLMCCVICDW